MNRVFLRMVLGGLFLIIALPFVLSKNDHKAPVMEASSAPVREVKAGDFAPGQLQAHFSKHGYQFGSISEEEYLEAARKLLDAPTSDNILEKTRETGDVERYNPRTHEFAVMTKTGRIRTYFIAKEGYWDRQ